MKKKAYWTRHTHLFRKDEYICSVCRNKAPKPTETCPNCGSVMRGSRTDVNWVDEMEGMDAILDD
ncbi:MAG: hypothetical protein IKI01_03445 [Lachnospiraceae bacterium]|jgi:predicted amidophosphoribosyltransferase|nr:hypothetical protein [Lachnospiraceae bacterium]